MTLGVDSRRVQLFFSLVGVHDTSVSGVILQGRPTMHKTLDVAAYKSYKIWQQHYVVSCFRMLPQKYCIILDKKATGD